MLRPRHAHELRNPSELIASLLRDGIAVAFEADGMSMLPTIRPGDKLRVEPATQVREGDVVLTSPGRLTAHRVIRVVRAHDGMRIVTRGDNSAEDDDPITARELLGIVVSISREGRQMAVDRRDHPRSLRNRIRRRLRALHDKLRGR